MWRVCERGVEHRLACLCLRWGAPIGVSVSAVTMASLPVPPRAPPRRRRRKPCLPEPEEVTLEVTCVGVKCDSLGANIEVFSWG